MHTVRPSSSRLDVFLLPGAYVVGDHRHLIRTLLGSCVSITLWHPTLRVGAMSHFLLSSRARTEPAGCCPPDPRYGEEAMALMLKSLKDLGVPHSQCQAKIFGGGEMFPHVKSAASQGVGRKNGESARRLL